MSEQDAGAYPDLKVDEAEVCGEKLGSGRICIRQPGHKGNVTHAQRARNAQNEAIKHLNEGTSLRLAEFNVQLAQSAATLALVESEETANLLKLHELSGRRVPSWGAILERMGFGEEEAPKPLDPEFIAEVMSEHIYNGRNMGCGCGKLFNSHGGTTESLAEQHRNHVAEKIAEAIA